MSRILCQRCAYPEATCICDYLTPVSHQTKLIVLQHPSEVKHAKNTVKLLSLISNNLQVIVGETIRDFEQIKRQTEKNSEQFYILFPSDNAKTWLQWQEVNTENKELNSNQPITIIIIDGTWKKAKKILLLNPWLQTLNELKIEGKTTNYNIRKTSIPGALSTIEATSIALSDIEGINITPFEHALQGLNNNFTQQMP